MIAIIGASGFIGRNLSKYFLDRGFQILPVYFSRETYLKNEIQFEELLMASDIPIDTVVFCAGNSNHFVSNYDLFSIIKKDGDYIQRFFESFKHLKSILISSAAVYYGYNGLVDENLIPKPNVNYGLSKRIAEMIFEKEICLQKSLGIVFRLTHVYGAGERNNRLFRNVAKAIKHGQVLKVHGTGSSFINPIPIEFLCEVVAHFLKKDFPTSGVEFYNVGSSESITVKDMVTELNKYFSFDYVFDEEERQPVNFITNVEKLAGLGLRYGKTVEGVVNYIRLINES